MANAALYFGADAACSSSVTSSTLSTAGMPPRLRHDGEPPRQIRPVERHREEEAQGRDRAVDARRLHAALRLVQLEEAQLFRRRRVGRPADEGRECPHVPDIIAPRVLIETAHAHVFDHARPQRADGPR